MAFVEPLGYDERKHTITMIRDNPVTTHSTVVYKITEFHLLTSIPLGDWYAYTDEPSYNSRAGRVVSYSGTYSIEIDTKVTHISCNRSMCVVLCSDGTARYALKERFETFNHTKPWKFEVLETSGVVSMCSTNNQVLLLHADGRVSCVGVRGDCHTQLHLPTGDYSSYELAERSTPGLYAVWSQRNAKIVCGGSEIDNLDYDIGRVKSCVLRLPNTTMPSWYEHAVVMLCDDGKVYTHNPLGERPLVVAEGVEHLITSCLGDYAIKSDNGKIVPILHSHELQPTKFAMLGNCHERR